MTDYTPHFGIESEICLGLTQRIDNNIYFGLGAFVIEIPKVEEITNSLERYINQIQGGQEELIPEEIRDLFYNLSETKINELSNLPREDLERKITDSLRYGPCELSVEEGDKILRIHYGTLTSYALAMLTNSPSEMPLHQHFDEAYKVSNTTNFNIEGFLDAKINNDGEISYLMVNKHGGSVNRPSVAQSVLMGIIPNVNKLPIEEEKTIIDIVIYGYLNSVIYKLDHSNDNDPNGKIPTKS